MSAKLWSAAAWTPLSHSSVCRQIEEWESGVKAAALQRPPPILMSGLNAIDLKARLRAFSLSPRAGGRLADDQVRFDHDLFGELRLSAVRDAIEQMFGG